jgi:NitT/TauT family transport system permease protein
VQRATKARIVFLVAAIGLVEILCRTDVIARFTMIPPSEMATGLFRLLASGQLNSDMITTLGAVGIALASSISIGMTLGALIHVLPRVRRTIDPILVSYYAVPVFVFYPIFIVLFGLNNIPKIVIGFLYAVAAMVINTLNGLDRVPPVLIKTARVFGLSGTEVALRVVMPYAAPYLFTGVKLAIAYSFIGVIGSEFILSSGGLGYSISYAYNNFDNQTMYSLILFILAVVLAVNMSLHAWEKRLMQRRGFR